MSKIQYNTDKERLVMLEYGRAVHDMVQHCMTIEDRGERLRCANVIVEVMAKLNKEKLGNPETQVKLWNHLAQISGFRLDVDYPVDIVREEEHARPDAAMSSPQHGIRYRHYGHLIEQAMEILKSMPEGEERDALVRQTADRMKQNLFTWNPNIMSEDKVAYDIDTYVPQKNLSEALRGHKYAPLHSLPTQVSPAPKRKNKK